MIKNKIKLSLIISISLVFINSFAQIKKIKSYSKKQNPVVLVVDNFIEILSVEDSEKKYHLTLLLKNTDPNKEYAFNLEIDNKIEEYKISTNIQTVFSYDTSFKIISSEILKYKLIDKKKIIIQLEKEHK